MPKRRRSEAEDLESLLHLIVREFKGAYGLVYIFDEGMEMTDGRGIYSVKIIKRGQVTVSLDPFLSPTIPNVEDEDL